MKKLILIFLLLSPVFMYACKEKGSDNKEETSQTEANKVAAEEKTTQKDKGDDKAAIHINEEEFKKKIMNYEKHDTWQFAGNKPCIVDFYADWCAPCRITSPILEDLAQEYKGKINVYKVDIEKNRKLASVFGVRSIPTFLYCPVDGKPRKAQGIGKSKEATKQMFKKNIETILLNNK